MYVDVICPEAVIEVIACDALLPPVQSLLGSKSLSLKMIADLLVFCRYTIKSNQVGLVMQISKKVILLWHENDHMFSRLKGLA